MNQANQIKPVVLILDEFNWLTDCVLDNKLPAEIFNFIRYILEEGSLPRIILAGIQSPNEIAIPEAQELLKSCELITIEELTIEQSADLIQKPLESVIDFDQEAVKSLYSETHGHPYLIQVICHDIVERLNYLRTRSFVTLEDVHQTILSTINKGGHFFPNILSSLSRPARDLLSSISNVIKPGERISITRIMEARPDLSVEELQLYLGELQRRLIIEYQQEDRSYGIKIPILHNWLITFPRF
jgi:hypothetical protein